MQYSKDRNSKRHDAETDLLLSEIESKINHSEMDSSEYCFLSKVRSLVLRLSRERNQILSDYLNVTARDRMLQGIMDEYSDMNFSTDTECLEESEARKSLPSRRNLTNGWVKKPKKLAN